MEVQQDSIRPPGFIGAHKAGMSGGTEGIGGQGAALDIAAPNHTVVAADHAAQHGARVGGDVAVDHGAVGNDAVVVMGQHGGVIREENIGPHDGQVVDVAGGADIGEETGVVVAQRQAGDLGGRCRPVRPGSGWSRCRWTLSWPDRAADSPEKSRSAVRR